MPTPTEDEDDAKQGAATAQSTLLWRCVDWLRGCRALRRTSPLYVKVGLVTIASMLIGVLIGVTEARTQFAGWPLMVGLTFALGAVWAVARGWIVAPTERIVRQIERAVNACESGGHRDLRRLPCNREDELGRLAHAFQRLGNVAIQSQHEARALRRDMDNRVQQSTQRATSQLRRLAHRDPLTDLGNRRCLDEMLPQLMQTAQRANHDVVCVVIDVDNFKQINDTLGHARGDEALLCLAQLIDGCVRSGDLAVRLGGDEFVIFLPGAGIARAGTLVEQIQGIFRQRMRSALGNECWTDLSVGIASLHRDGCVDGQALLRKADEHLYQAKRAGKGRCHGAGTV